MTEAGTGTVERTIRIGARPETVWRFWTDPDRMTEWWGVAAELDPRPRGVCRVDTGRGPVMRGEFVELRPYERIVFSFGWERAAGVPDIAPGSTLVEVTLVPDGDGTVLTLRHSGLPAERAPEHGGGWAHVLPLLGAAAAR